MTIFIIILLAVWLLYLLFMSSYSAWPWHIPYRIKTDEKVVALTFDDGPNEPYTSQIVNFLNSKNIKATFFEVGKCLERHPEVSKKILASGHVIGNHSLSHEFHKYVLHPGFNKEIEQTQKIFKKVIGKEPALFRAPWLWRTPWLIKTLRQSSLQPVSGRFCHSFEVFQIDGKKIAKRAIAKAKPGAIIIFHDGFDGRGGNRAETVKAVKITVNELLKQGYKFATIGELLGIPAYKIN